MRIASLLSVFVGITLTGAVFAQPGIILKEEDVTQENIIKELAPSRQFSVEAEKPAAVSLLITFQTNSANLTPAALKSLDALGGALQAGALAPFKFAVEGHADPRGAFERNMRLSQARAQSVVSYLVANYQIRRDRLRAVGKGSTELYNAAEPTAAQNRRVTIRRLPDEGQ